VDHLLAIIHDVLSLSQIEADRLQIESVAVDPLEICTAVSELVSDDARRKGLRLDIQCAAVPARLLGDPTRLRQALLNYLANAVKFTDAGKITLRCVHEGAREAGEMLRFEVVDSGPGLEPAVIDRLFAPFEQADNSATRNFGGTGLGLVITRCRLHQPAGRRQHLLVHRLPGPGGRRAAWRKGDGRAADGGRRRPASAICRPFDPARRRQLDQPRGGA
jgi:signal transduction histidine kinase